MKEGETGCGIVAARISFVPRKKRRDREKARDICDAKEGKVSSLMRAKVSFKSAIYSEVLAFLSGGPCKMVLSMHPKTSSMMEAH